MASTENLAIVLGYSGGAVPDSHRVPCLSAAVTKAADHQRTSNSQQPNNARARCKAPPQYHHHVKFLPQSDNRVIMRVVARIDFLERRPRFAAANLGDAAAW
jgi:hypothetical protein